MKFYIKFDTINEYENMNTYCMYVQTKNWAELGDTIDKMLEADPFMKIRTVRISTKI